MCHEWWTRRELRREECSDEEIRHLFEEELERTEPPMPVVEHEVEEEPAGPERVRV